jgi:hypothetical protein
MTEIYRRLLQLGVVLVVVLVLMAWQRFYMIGFLLVGSMYFVLPEFVQQISRRCRLTPISGFTLIIILPSSVFLSYILIKWAGVHYANWTIFMAAPLFVWLAATTLGIWEMLTLSHLTAAVEKAERLVAVGEAEIRRLETAMLGVTRQMEQIRIDNRDLLERRRNLEEELRDFCTEAGDHRGRIMHKERLEKRLADWEASALDERARELRQNPEPGPEDHIELILIDLRALEFSNDQALGRLQSLEAELTRLEDDSQRFLTVHREAEQNVAMARQALETARTETIVLN